MSKGAVSIVGVVVAVVAGAATRAAVRSILTPDMKSERVLSQVASQMNRDLPTMVDAETQLVSCSAAPARFTYNYKLVHVNGAELDATAFTNVIRPQVTTGACTTKETRHILDGGVTLVYSYVDRSDNAVADVDVSASNCR